MWLTPLALNWQANKSYIPPKGDDEDEPDDRGDEPAAAAAAAAPPKLSRSNSASGSKVWSAMLLSLCLANVSFNPTCNCAYMFSRVSSRSSMVISNLTLRARLNPKTPSRNPARSLAGGVRPKRRWRPRRRPPPPPSSLCGLSLCPLKLVCL